MLKKILKLFGLIFLLFILLIVFLLFRLYNAESVLNDFQNSLVRGDFIDAYSMMTIEYKKKHSLSEFVSALEKPLPPMFNMHQKEQLIGKYAELIQFDVIEKNVFDNNQFVIITLKYPCQNTFQYALEERNDIESKKNELSNIAKEDAIKKTGEYILMLLESIKANPNKFINYYETDKIKINLEFEFYQWKINNIQEL